MGTDIHLHIELKIGGAWEHYQAPSIFRDYELFAKLAGVRRDDPKPIVEPRGLPGDVTLLTGLEAKKHEGDMHHASWLGPAEIDELRMWWEAREELLRKQYENRDYKVFEQEIAGGYLFGGSYTLSESHPWVQDIRFIFWFDC